MMTKAKQLIAATALSILAAGAIPSTAPAQSLGPYERDARIMRNLHRDMKGLERKERKRQIRNGGGIYERCLRRDARACQEYRRRAVRAMRTRDAIQNLYMGTYGRRWANSFRY